MLELRIVPLNNDWYNLHFVFSPRGGISAAPKDCSLGKFRFAPKQTTIAQLCNEIEIVLPSGNQVKFVLPRPQASILDATQQLLERAELIIPDLKLNFSLWPERGLKIKIVNSNTSEDSSKSANYDIFLNDQLMGMIENYNKELGRRELLRRALRIVVNQR